MKTRSPLLACALSFASLSVAQATGLVNGSFESPVLGPSVTVGIDYTIASPPPAAFGWQLASGAIDLLGTYWQAASGVQSVDMNGDFGSDPGVIYQDFSFSHAGTWAISFSLSANPDSPSPANRSIRIDFGTSGGSLNSLGTWTVSVDGKTHANMGWATFTTPTITVQDAVVYRLEFSSLSPAPYGPALDNVQLVAVPEPSTMALAGLGAAALMSLRRRR